ncbi:DNA translocase FtsK [Acinetobacter pollinis]|uniref:DNA translocase FtsK n=1 Tax=Acinetobacter pollinis TaxID=2605270 RepID=UPI0018A3129D|nr:DNA translocase FtsK [Acinetobacter pollinis]MBF7689854.1 DNA translocase FtsK 4TM domain-containing protein [Acinetobacter pollinis]MBF7697294.1 DNA translocase FtsK 4TM domain-containing protein [Acinetobacter pollinis]
MTAVSSVYAQRLITTLFLVSFGIYLFLATVTYTPFDPGWMHISSDTQQVSNASGVAGAWIADLLFGFLGWASLLIPIFLFIEAIQVWWPRSFLSRPFRYAAQFFILLATSSLLYLFWNVPTDALTNASGGIIGYELGESLSHLITIYGASLFLIVLWGVLFTLAFGIQWNKTWATLQATPKYLQDLFYRNVPEAEAAYDKTTAPKKIEKLEENEAITQEAEKAPIENIKKAPDADPAAEKLFDDLVVKQAEHESVTSKVSTPTTKATPHSSNSTVATGQVWRVPDQNTEDEQQKEIHALLKASEDENITHTPHSSVNWDDDQVFNDLLKTVPKDAVAPDVHTPFHIESEKTENTSVAKPSVASTSYDSHVDDIEKLLALDQKESEPEIQHTPVEETNKSVVESKPRETNSYAQSSAFVQADIQTHLNTTLSKEEFLSAWQETAGKPDEEEDEFDFDAPLTDASGRPMSRAMQVVAKRKGLSTLPEKSLLDEVDPNKKVNFTEEQLARLSELLEIKLQEFNVKATVVEAQPGPVVTRFELDLAPGVKASKVTNISRDLARSMSMASVRVVEVIPGKPYIGIEVPNSSREMVRLTELLNTQEYLDPNGLISMAMGKDISGQPVLTDLAKAPHMLVAGTTGSGKSVAVNAMLLSMLLKYTPQDLRLILIDPKQLELANYSDIPHLLTPVVTDMKDAVSALNWCVNEMERRYKLMSFLKVRKIVDYNRKVKEALETGEDLIDPTWKPSDSATQERAPRLQTLPMIVIVADEFADMIMQVGKKAEEMITRLAQKSRAAGIHLLLATQRPSVDVITGLIKANIPTRVALRVNSKIDSRTILDAGGAEDLLGHGDMLFLGPGKIEPERLHGAFISDDEVNRICDAWRERGDPDYVDEILTPYDEEPSARAGGEGGEGASDRDVLYDQAVAFVLESRKASASSLQRKFSLGYNRAARLIDQMEDNGVVSAAGPNSKREILV